MSLFISAIASGSNGNCYYVGNGAEAVLVDVGISCREVERRMQRLQLPFYTVKAIFISHEHGDHISGLQQLAKKWQVPIYITTATAGNCRLAFKGHCVQPFYQHQAVSIGALSVTSFSKAHDAADPHSFVVDGNGVRIGVFTDIGITCAQLIRYFGSCHAAFLEANYDEKMLAAGTYPAHLKARIRGGKGHLSNRQAFDLFEKHRPSHMSHLILAHLSKNNNAPECVQRLFSTTNHEVEIVIASRYQETPVFEIKAGVPAKAIAHYIPPVSQLQFAF